MTSPENHAAQPAPPLQHLLHPDNDAEFAAGADASVDLLRRRLAGVSGPSTGTTPESAARAVGLVDLDRPLGELEAALAELGDLWLDDAVWFHEPGYAAHLNCPVVIPAVLGETLLGAVNPSMDTFDQSVGATFMERALIQWTAERIGWESGSGEPRPDGIFTSGGSQSNLQGLQLARDAALERGVPLHRMRFLASAEAHFSVQKSARLLGLGSDAVVPVATDSRHRMEPPALDRAIDACALTGCVPVAVVATAGTTDFGAIDPLPAIAERAQAAGLWLHVDAAYGGGLLVSRRHRQRLAGVELADSVTVDYHKTWFQPVSSSALLVREAATLRHVTWHADYLNPADAENPNQVDKSLQTTRRFDAVKLWLTLRVMGADAIGEYVDAVIDLAREVHRELIEDYPELEVAAAPELSTLVFRWHPDPDSSEEQLTRTNLAIRSALYSGGGAMVAATKVDGRDYLKLTLLNPKADVADVLAILDLVCAAGRELTPSRAAHELVVSA